MEHKIQEIKNKFKKYKFIDYTKFFDYEKISTLYDFSNKNKNIILIIKYAQNTRELYRRYLTCQQLSNHEPLQSIIINDDSIFQSMYEKNSCYGEQTCDYFFLIYDDFQYFFHITSSINKIEKQMFPEDYDEDSDNSDDERLICIHKDIKIKCSECTYFVHCNNHKLVYKFLTQMG
jgi:hypothetical protein